MLREAGIWQEHYHSKTIDTVLEKPFDLIVTVCDHAKESCPMFPKAVKTLHVGFEDPDGKPIETFYETLKEIETTLLPRIKEELCA